MIIDKAPDAAELADICIVGSGPVGLALAFRCARLGLSVTVLEAGYPVACGDRASPPAMDVLNGHHVGADRATMRALGGTAHLWGGRCVPFDDVDFPRRAHVDHSGWPITHDALAGYYPDALHFLGCEAHADSVGLPENGPVQTRNLEWWSRSSNIAALHAAEIEAATGVRIHTGCVVRALLPGADGRRIAALAVERGGQTRRVQARYFALAGGGLENARLLLQAQRSRPHLFGGAGGPLGRFYCGHLTGYLAEIRFRDPSYARRLWFRRRKAGGVDRRRLAISPGTQARQGLLNTAFWLDSYSIADAAHGSGLLSALYLGMKGLSLLPRMRSGLAPADTSRGGFRRHAGNLRRAHVDMWACRAMARHLVGGGDTPGAMALFNPEGRYLLRYHAEHAPNPDSRVTLDAEDRLRVDLRFSEADLSSVIRSHTVLDTWLRAEEIGALHYHAPPEAMLDHARGQALDGYHQIGLTRMSEDSRSGVVDADCRAHGLDNLYLAGSSVFTTAGQANPTLPAVALALRTGDHLAARCHQLVGGARIGSRSL